MMYKTIIQVFRFLILVLFQVMILNHLNLSGYMNPYLYIYFILLLPYSTPRWLLLLLAFALGLIIDLFTYTPGLNASATLLVAFVRPFVIRLISGAPETELGWEPSLRENGLSWFLSYSVILILIHHTALFYLEMFRFTEFFDTLWRILLSSAFTLVLVFLSELIFFHAHKEK